MAVNTQERLEFLVNFCNADLAAYREGDWLNLKADVEQFIQPPQGEERVADLGWVFPLEDRYMKAPAYTKMGGNLIIPAPEELSQEELTTLWSGTRCLLVALADAERILESGGAPPEPGEVVPIKGGVKLMVAPSDIGGQLMVLWIGSARDVFFAIILSMATSEALPPIRICMLDECDQIFIRRSRQLYCSSDHARLDRRQILASKKDAKEDAKEEAAEEVKRRRAKA